MMIRAAILSLLLTACAHTGTIADGATTVVGIAGGASEANPIIAASPSIAGPAVIAARIAVVERYRGTERCEPIARGADSIGWFAGGANLATIAGASSVVAAPVGVIFAIAANKWNRDRLRSWCRPEPCSLADLPSGTSSAHCDNGRILVVR